MTNSLPLEAQRIAELGYPVFPCRDPRDDPSEVGKKGKIPLISNGVSGATINLDKIDEWWAKWPTANIGLRCKHCLVIDLDNKDGKNGSADLARIAEQLGQLHPVTMAASGSGGWHLFFAKPDVDIIGRTNVEWNGNKTGIDIRVGNQYVIAPPSLHESGKFYTWHTPLVPLDQLTPVPKKWIDGFLPKKGSNILLPAKPVRELPTEKVVARCRKYVATMPKAISGQDGHRTTLPVANAIFWGFGLDEATGWPILVDYSMGCQPPWSEAELRHKMKDAIEKPPRGKEFGWLLNAKRYEHGDFDYYSRSDTEKRPSTAKLIAPRLSTFDRENVTFLWK
ncbi:MAG: bifunctional DNA primase/polymerase, partial [Planctomycetaceae bacterium]|nr:bifunctional DNA primase/polymerase [Planctomycetaceae bacterium]